MRKQKIDDFIVSEENRIVAFIDVLGFKNLLKDKSSEKIREYFATVQTSLKGLAALKGKKLEKALLSDSIILSLPFSEDDAAECIRQMLHAVASVQNLLLQKSILTRGGISIGSLLIDEKTNIVVGTGLARAYELETSAKYPRVIIDPKLVDEYFEDRRAFVRSMNNTEQLIYSFKVREDNKEDPLASKFFFVNYISYYPGKTQEPFGTTYWATDENKNILKHIRKGIKTQEAFEKYNWLATYLGVTYPSLYLQINSLTYGARRVF